MAQKPWFASYPSGIPHEINPDTYSSVVQLVDQSCQKYHSRTAYQTMGVEMSYAEVDRLSQNFAAYLQKVAGLKKGDRIALQMPNVLQYPIALFGALRAGLVVVNTNPLYTEREMAHQFNDSGAKAIVILSHFADKLEKVLPETKLETVIVTNFADLFPFGKRQMVNGVLRYVKNAVPSYNLPTAIGFRDALDMGASHGLDKVDVTGDDLAFLQYTGGTTGVSKGAMLTHRNVIANMLQVMAWIGSTMKDGEEIAVTALPLYHVFSLTVNGLSMFMKGATSILIPNPRDLRAFAKELVGQKVTFISGVNTLFNSMCNAAPFKTLDYSALKIGVGGGMAVQKATSDMWERMTGKPLIEGYGLTEASPLIACNRADGKIIIGTIGLPVPSTDVRMVKDDGTDADFGEPGELWAKGPQVMAGYWNNPEETEKVITSDGWLKTGDIGIFLDGGYIKLVDRKKEMILVSGFNVYPNEIEDVVTQHPGVLECAVIGVPDEKAGEAVKAFVVKKDPNLTAEDLKEFCRKNLVGYKCPRYFEFRADLPKTNIGKILRRALKETK